MKMRQILLLLAAFSVCGSLMYGCSKNDPGVDAPAGANTPTQPPRQAPPGKVMLKPSAAGGGGSTAAPAGGGGTATASPQ